MKRNNVRVCWYSYNKERDEYILKCGYANGFTIKVDEESEYYKGVGVIFDFDEIVDKGIIAIFNCIENPYDPKKEKTLLHFNCLTCIREKMNDWNYLFIGQFDKE